MNIILLIRLRIGDKKMSFYSWSLRSLLEDKLNEYVSNLIYIDLKSILLISLLAFKHGTTKTSELIDVIQFYESTIYPDLADPNG